MVFPSVFLTHHCVITQHRAVSTNPFGETVYADTVLPERRCRFFPVTEASDDRTVYSAKLVLEPTEDIQQNDIVESSDPGFARRYWVNSVTQVYEATGGISHTTALLRETEHLEEQL